MENTHFFSKNDIESFEQRYRANFVNSLSGYKSAYLVGTQGKDNSNLAVFNSIFHIGANPALMGMISRPNSVPRHTLENIRLNKFYTLNHVETSFLKQAHQTSARYESYQSEFQEVGLTEVYCNGFLAPYVQEAHFKIGMKFVREVFIPENETVMIIGEVEQVYIDKKNIEQDGFIDFSNIPLVVAASLDGYSSLLKLTRLPYAKP